jgi:AbrB family looped-hinge helix DNA binding protein
MKAVTVSQRFQVTIPAAQRRRLGLRAGDRLMAIDHDGLLALVPVRPAAEMRGFLAGLDTSLVRDGDRGTSPSAR